MRNICHKLVALCLLCIAAEPARADVIFGFDPDPLRIVQGTPQTLLDLVISNPAGGSGVLSSFTYALSVERISGTGSVTLLGTPVLLPGVDTWNSVPAGSSPTIYAANVNPPGGSGLFVDFPARVVQFTLDTSGALAGDVYSITPNFNNFAAASDAGVPYGVSSQVRTLSVAAVPEPSSVAVLGGLIGIGACLRRRKRELAGATAAR